MNDQAVGGFAKSEKKDEYLNFKGNSNQSLQTHKKSIKSDHYKTNQTNATEYQTGPHNEVSNRTEQVEYELEEPEFDMSDMDESIMNSSYRGAGASGSH